MFIQGQIYKRKIIHDEYVGQEQGGISTPVNSPIILLFSGEQGEQFGYEDGWNNGKYLYTGEGQVGEMEFVRGYKAIIEHSKNEKDIHLFKYTKAAGKVEYIGQMICSGFIERIGSDRNGTQRKLLVFELEPISKYTIPQYEEEIEDTTLWLDEEIRKKAFDAARETPRNVERKQTTKQRSEIIRVYVLRRALGICENCGKEAPFSTDKGKLYLEPHHILRLSDGGPDNPMKMAALCPNCHRESHYGKRREEINTQLLERISLKEKSN